TYALMLLAAPVFDTRYAWPLFPLIAAAFVVGIARLVAFARTMPDWRDAQRVGVLAVALPLVAFASVRTFVRPEPPSLLGKEDVQALLHEVRTTMSPAT